MNGMNRPLIKQPRRMVNVNTTTTKQPQEQLPQQLLLTISQKQKNQKKQYQIQIKSVKTFAFVWNKFFENKLQQYIEKILRS